MGGKIYKNSGHLKENASVSQARGSKVLLTKQGIFLENLLAKRSIFKGKGVRAEIFSNAK